MIDFTKLTDEELNKWNDDLLTKLMCVRKGWLTYMKEHWLETHSKVKSEMKKRGLVYTIRISEQA